MKKVLLVALLVASVLLSGCSTKVEPEQESETAYFNFTASELICNLEEWMIDFLPMGVFDSEDGTEKISAYTSSNDVFTTEEKDYANIHYSIVYDDTTNKVSSISFFLDRNSVSAAERLFYHLVCIAKTIDENEELDNITAEIINDDKELEGIYEGERLKVCAINTDGYYDIYITPTTK